MTVANVPTIQSRFALLYILHTLSEFGSLWLTANCNNVQCLPYIKHTRKFRLGSIYFWNFVSIFIVLKFNFNERQHRRTAYIHFIDLFRECLCIWQSYARGVANHLIWFAINKIETRRELNGLLFLFTAFLFLPLLLFLVVCVIWFGGCYYSCCCCVWRLLLIDDNDDVAVVDVNEVIINFSTKVSGFILNSFNSSS